MTMRPNPSPDRRAALPRAALLALLLLPLIAGCGGGGATGTSGGGSGGSGGGSGVTGTLRGYIYVPVGALGLAPGLPGGPAPDAGTAEALTSPALRAAPSGYIPLSDAVVQLKGTTKATITTTEGFFSFKIDPSDNIRGYAKVTITKPNVNISIEFEAEITGGGTDTYQIEVSIASGETWIKRLNPSGDTADADFVYITGRVETSTGLILAGASVNAQLTSNPLVTQTTSTDGNGIFKLKGLSEGTWRVTAGRPGYRSVEKTVTASPTYSLTNINFALPGTFDIYNILATRFTGQTVTLEYMTSVPTVTQVEYGLTPTYGNITPQESSYVNTHSVVLSGLSINTLYHYRVKAKDTNDNQVYSADQTFTTTDGTTQDTSPPEIFTYTVTKTHNSIKVVYTLSKNSYGRVEWATASGGPYTQSLLLQPAATTFSFTITNLTPATKYWIVLKGINIYNANDPASTASLALDPVETDATPDTTPPAVSGARVVEVKPTSARLAWETLGELSNSQVYYGFTPGAPFNPAGKTNAEIEAYLTGTYSNKSASFDENPLVSAHDVTIGGLAIERTYYARVVSRDPAGNPGISATELTFSTPKPGTTIALSTTIENPGNTAIAVGEEFTALAVKVAGSGTEPVALTRLVMRNTGTAAGADFESIKLVRSGFLPVTGVLSAGTIIFDFASASLEVPLSGEGYFTLAIKMKESAIGKTVRLGLEDKSRVVAWGNTYNRAAEASNAFPFDSALFTVSKGLLTLAPVGATAETTLNTGLSEVTVLEFAVTAANEDVYLDKIQIQQVPDTVNSANTASTSDFVNVRLFYGATPLASVPSSTIMEFISSGATGLIVVPKGQTRSLSIVINVPPSAVQGRTLQFRAVASGLTGRGRFSGLLADTAGLPVVGSKYTLGQSAVLVSSATDDPTPQIFVTGDAAKTLFAFTITAGGAEDVNVTSVAIAQLGTAATGDVTDFRLVADNQTKATATFTNPETVFSNPSGMIYIQKGTSKVVTVVGTINAVAGRTIILGIAAPGKVQGRGATSNTTKTSEGVASGSTHIVAGRMQALNAASTPSGTLVLAGTDRPLFDFTLRSVGEAVKIQTIYVKADGDTFGNERIVWNLKLSDEVNVSPYTNPDVTERGYAFNVNGAREIASGATATFKLYGDVGSNTAFVGKQVKYFLDEGSAIAIGQASNNQFASLYKVEGNALTITLGSLAFGSTPAVVPNATLVAGTLAAEIVGGFTLTAGAAENVTVSKIVALGEGFTYGAGGDLDDLQLFDGASLVATAVRNVGNFEFTPASALTINASSTKTFTLKAKVLASASARTNCQFRVNNPGATQAKGALSNLTLTPSGSALSPAFAIVTGGMSVSAPVTNPPDTDYPKNTAAEVEFLRFKIAVSALEGITPTRALFTRTVERSDIDMLDPASFALRLFDANGIYAGKTWSGSAVTVAGSSVTISLAAPALALAAGTTDCELRLFAKFDTTKTVPGASAKIDLGAGGLTGTTALSARAVAASGTVAGNQMSIVDVADTAAPVITFVPATDVTNVTSTTARVTWITNEPSSSLVYWRKNGDTEWNATAEFDANPRATAHTVELSGLSPSTAYDLKLRSVDAAGNAGETAEQLSAFTTAAQPTGTLTAALAPDTPALADVLTNQTVTFLKFTLEAANEDVAVKSIKFTAEWNGVTAANFGALTLTDGKAAYSASLSGTTVTFSRSDAPLYTVKAGASNKVTLTLSAPVSTDAGAGAKDAIFKIAAAADLVAEGHITQSAITPAGTAAVVSNKQTFVAGSVALAAGSAVPGTVTAHLPRATSVTMFDFKLTAGGTEKVGVTRIRIRQNLSARFGEDLWNARLYDGPTVLASATSFPDPAEVVFGTGTTAFLTLDAGATKTLALVVDVTAAATAGRRAEFTLDPSDITAAGVATGLSLTAGGAAQTGEQYLIGSAALTVALASDSPASTVFRPGTAVGQTFARFKLTVGSAEDVNTTQMNVRLWGTAADTADLANLKLSDGTRTWPLTYSSPNYGYSTAVTFARNQVYTLTLTGDVVGTNAGRNFWFTLESEAIQGTGSPSGLQVKSSGTATSATHYLRGDLNLGAGTAAMPTQSSADYVAGNTAFVPLWTGKLTAANETVNVTALRFELASGGAGDLTGLYVKRDTAPAADYTSVTVESGKYVADMTTPTPLAVTTAQPVDLTVYAKIPVDTGSGGTSTVGNKLRLKLSAADIAASGATSGQSVTVSGDLEGNDLEVKKGGLTVSLDAGTPAAGDVLIHDAASDTIGAHYALAATAAEDVTVTKVTFTDTQTARYPADIRNAKLWFDTGGGWTQADGTTTLEGPTNGVYTFKDVQVGAAALTIPKSTSVKMRITASPGLVASNPEVGKAIQFTVAAGGVKGRGAISAASLPASTTNIESAGSATANRQTLAIGKLTAESATDLYYQSEYNQFVEAGTDAVKIFRFKLKAGDSAGASLENVRVTRIVLALTGDPTEFDSFTLFDGADTNLGIHSMAGNPTSPTITYDGGAGTLSDGVNPYYTVNAGATAVFYIQAKLKATATPGKTFTLKLEGADVLSGTGALSTRAVAGTGSASYLTYTIRKRSLTLESLDDPIPANENAKPGNAIPVLRFRMTAGGFEDLGTIKLKLKREGTAVGSLALQVAVFEGFTDGGTPLVPYTALAVEKKEFTFLASHVLAAGATKTYTVYAKPNAPPLTPPAEDGSTFKIFIESAGDATAVGAASNLAVTSTGTVSGATHRIRHSGVTVSLDEATPAAADVDLDTVFDALRFTVTGDGSNLGTLRLKKLTVTNNGVALSTTKWEIQGLYDAAGTLILGPSDWSCQDPASWTLTTPYTLLPAGSTASRTYALKVKAKAATGAVPGDSARFEIPATSGTDFQIEELLPNGADVTAKSSGTATGNLMRVRAGKVTFTALADEVRQKIFFPGTVNKHNGSVCAVFRITADAYEKINVTHLQFRFTGSAVYGTDFENPRVFLLGAGGGLAQTDTSGLVTPVGTTDLTTNYNITRSVTQITSATVSVELDGLWTDDAAEPDALPIWASSSQVVALVVDYPAAGEGGKELVAALSGITAKGASTLDVATPAPAVGPTISINPSWLALSALNNEKIRETYNAPAAANDMVLSIFKFRNDGTLAVTLDQLQFDFFGGSLPVYLSQGDFFNVNLYELNTNGGIDQINLDGSVKTAGNTARNPTVLKVSASRLVLTGCNVSIPANGGEKVVALTAKIYDSGAAATSEMTPILSGTQTTPSTRIPTQVFGKKITISIP